MGPSLSTAAEEELALGISALRAARRIGLRSEDSGERERPAVHRIVRNSAFIS